MLKRPAIARRRTDAGDIETGTKTAGEITLHPPGITFTVEEIYAA